MTTNRIQPVLVIAVVVLFSGFAVPQQNVPAKSAASEAFGEPALSQEQIRELIRRVADRDIENDKQQRNYTQYKRRPLCGRL
jgi:hypothetical protein